MESALKSVEDWKDKIKQRLRKIMSLEKVLYMQDMENKSKLH